MIFLGIIKSNDPTSLIDPKKFHTVDELHDFLVKALDIHNFSLPVPITKDLLVDGLKMEQPLIINFVESTVSFMLGEKEVIYANTSRFVSTGQKLLDPFTKI